MTYTIAAAVFVFVFVLLPSLLQTATNKQTFTITGFTNNVLIPIAIAAAFLYALIG